MVLLTLYFNVSTLFAPIFCSGENLDKFLLYLVQILHHNFKKMPERQPISKQHQHLSIKRTIFNAQLILNFSANKGQIY